MFSSSQNALIPNHARPLKDQKPGIDKPGPISAFHKCITVKTIINQKLPGKVPLPEQTRLEIRRAVRRLPISIDVDDSGAEEMLRIDVGNRRREGGLDSGQTGEVREGPGVVCESGGGEDRGEEGEVLGVDSQGVGVEGLVDLFPRGQLAGREVGEEEGDDEEDVSYGEGHGGNGRSGIGGLGWIALRKGKQDRRIDRVCERVESRGRII